MKSIVIVNGGDKIQDRLNEELEELKQTGDIEVVAFGTSLTSCRVPGTQREKLYVSVAILYKEKG